MVSTAWMTYKWKHIIQKKPTGNMKKWRKKRRNRFGPYYEIAWKEFLAKSKMGSYNEGYYCLSNYSILDCIQIRVSIQGWFTQICWMHTFMMSNPGTSASWPKKELCASSQTLGNGGENTCCLRFQYHIRAHTQHGLKQSKLCLSYARWVGWNLPKTLLGS